MTSFAGDDVVDFTPQTFALALVHALRRDKRTTHKPSLRMTIAVPRFLMARYCRIRRLTPADYLDAAVVNTVPDDQPVALEIARRLLFPDLEARKAQAQRQASSSSTTAASSSSVPQKSASVQEATSSILADMASLELDFDNIDALDIDAIDAAIADDEGAADVFDLFERLYSSADRSERALAELVVTFGGPAELAGVGADTVARVRGFALAQLLGTVGELTPAQVLLGCRAGFTTSLLHETTQPWELAGALAGEGSPDPLRSHLDDVMAGRDLRTTGLVLSFLRPHTTPPATLDVGVVDDMSAAALAACTDVHDAAELLIAEGRFQSLPPHLLRDSVVDNAPRAIAAGRRLEERFGEPVCAALFDAWLAGLDHEPTVGELVMVSVDCPAWVSCLDGAWARDLQQITNDVDTVGRGLPSLPSAVQDLVALADGLLRTTIDEGATLATKVATDAMCLVRDDVHFLPLLDDFLAHTVIPHDIERVIAAGDALGVDPQEIYDRIGDALEQLRAMILGGSHDADRYRRLVDKIVRVPDGMLDPCIAAALGTSNLEAIAALLALDLGAVAAQADDDVVSQCLGYKGIGGGSNLLKQWFTHRSTLRPELKASIKAQLKEALLDLAFQWMNAGNGSTDGLVPQSTSRPYAAGDELDGLDLDATLDAVIGSGKGLDGITTDDLFVQDATRGEAALLVLIDISGSMTGAELAMCAVAVVMLLGRVKPEEIALAVFESDTHVIKTFADASDLDDVADRVLDLEATGGTRVDAALTWARDQFDTRNDADTRLLFLLSDFMFFETAEELRRHARTLGDGGVKLLAASHGIVDDKTVELLLSEQGGQQIKLKSMAALPAILIEALEQIGN